MPVSMGLAVEQVPASRTSTEIGGIQAAFTIGMALGPFAGGLFAEHLQWRGFYVFLAVAGVIAASTVAIAYSGPPPPYRRRKPAAGFETGVGRPGGADGLSGRISHASGDD